MRAAASSAVQVLPVRFSFVGRLPPRSILIANRILQYQLFAFCFHVVHGAEMINKKKVIKVSGKSNDLLKNYTCAQNVNNKKPTTARTYVKLRLPARKQVVSVMREEKKRARKAYCCALNPTYFELIMHNLFNKDFSKN